MIDNEFLKQLFEQHGLLGLLIGFLILGPGFTYIRSRNTQLQIEAKAQELVNEFALHHRQQAEQLEKRLNKTLSRLGQAREEASLLKLKLLEAQQDLEEVPQLRQQITSLGQKMKGLETLVETGKQENTRLQAEIQRNRQRIDPLTPSAN